MIAVDSSVLIAILERVPDAPIFAAAIRYAERIVISAPMFTNAELSCAVATVVAAQRLWRFLREENDFQIVPFDESQARAALIAFDRYGKGINSKARLNLSACAAYALAKSSKCLLLFKGGDSSQTDADSAL